MIFAGLGLGGNSACVGSHRSRSHGRNLWGSGHRSGAATALRLLRQSAKDSCGLGVSSRATSRGQGAKQAESALGTIDKMFEIFMPFIHALGGFIVGVVLAMIYNFAARWTGGIEFLVDDKP